LILGEYFLGKVQKKIGNFAMPFKYRVSLAGHKSRCFSKPRKIWHFRPFMKSLKFLNPYLLRYRTRLILGTLFITISNIFAIYPAEVLRKGIDMVQDRIHVYALFKGLPMENELRSDFFNILLLFGVIVIITALLKGLFMFFMRQTIIVMSRLIEYDLKNDIYQHYQKLDLAFYKKNKTGDLMARISEDVSQVRMYVGPAIMYAISTITLFLLVMVRMLTINAELTLYVLAPLPILALTIYYVNSRVIKKSEAVQKQLSTISSWVQESFSGIRVVKAYNREKFNQDKFAIEANQYKDRNVELVKVNALFFPMIILLIGLSTLITIYAGGIKVFSGEITTGTIAEFIMYVNMLTWPVASIGWVTSIVQRAAASQTRINEFLSYEPSVVNQTQDATPIKGSLRFEKVSFVYPDSGIVAIKDISFSVAAGQSVAIIGRTGSGKSTLAALITRQYDVSSGQIYIDETPLQKINLNSLRSAIGYVPQEVFLFSETISNNIAFGFKPNHLASDEDQQSIEQAAKDAAIYDSIIQFPEGFSTRVGERGVTLSGGQKQRISIARAIIRKPEVLIFDDCLSAVDTATEEEVLTNLRRIMKGRTSVIIAHRISTVKHCDQIIVLDHGSIVEQGTHQDLINKDGIYAELNRKQLLEEASAQF
jgi:ATP-binding cassette subfamily B protein